MHSVWVEDMEEGKEGRENVRDSDGTEFQREKAE